jgi:hypothetical protein
MEYLKGDPPPKVKGWPTPWINHEDFKQYVVPLFSHPWGIKFLPRKTNEKRSLCLSGFFRFETWNESKKFLDAVHEISNAEKVLLTPNAPK